MNKKKSMAETSPTRVRGKLVVLGSVCNTVGFCLSNWINYALYSNHGPFQWRFPLGFQLVFPLIVVLFLPFVVESPRWLLLRNREADALAALASLHGVVDLDNKALNDDLKAIVKTIQAERRQRAPWRDVLLFRDGTQNLRRLLLRYQYPLPPSQSHLYSLLEAGRDRVDTRGRFPPLENSCGTQLMQQFTGVNAMGYYLPTFLTQSVGVSSDYARLLTAANATLYLGAAFLCLILIDLVGRRR